jgi:Cysteine dioxygenase type I
MDIHPALRGAVWTRSLPVGGQPVDSETLAALVAGLADRPDLWADLVRHAPLVRWYERVALTDTVEVWLIGWWRDQHTPMHDHGGASGALAVVGGVLQETTLRPARPAVSRLLPSGTLIEVPPAVIHRVGNVFPVPATSIHAYSPPNLEMTSYEQALPAPALLAAAA